MPYVKRKNYRRPRRRVGGKKRSNPKKVTVAKLSRQVSRLSKSVKRDTEVKQYSSVNAMAGTVGQVDVNATGLYAADMVIMNLAAGVDADERIGLKVKLIGTSIRIQIQQQSACDFYNKFIIDIVGTTDFGATPNTIANRIYNADSISQVIDANSTRDYNQLRTKTNGGLQDSWIMASRSLVVGKDSTTATQPGFKDIKMFVKSNQQLIWGGPALNPPGNMRMLIIVRAQAGNKSTGTASTLPNIPSQLINTGAFFRCQFTNYYTDI